MRDDSSERWSFVKRRLVPSIFGGALLTLIGLEGAGRAAGSTIGEVCAYGSCPSSNFVGGYLMAGGLVVAIGVAAAALVYYRRAHPPLTERPDDGDASSPDAGEHVEPGDWEGRDSSVSSSGDVPAEPEEYSSPVPPPRAPPKSENVDDLMDELDRIRRRREGLL
jgi:hypothetical protein